MKADALRFGEQPESTVRFGGSPKRRSVSGSERVNLPERVEAGEDYRDVQVDYRLATGLTGRGDEPAAGPHAGAGAAEPADSGEGHEDRREGDEGRGRGQGSDGRDGGRHGPGR